MKIDVNYQFKNLDGEGIKETGGNIGNIKTKLDLIKTWDEFKVFRDDIKQGSLFTLKKACVAVLLNPIEGKLKAEEKIERYYLAQKIHQSNGLVDLRPKEITLLQELIAIPYPPLTVAQAYEILDPHEAGKEKK